MSNYKREVTLNEKDSLIDMLNLEKTLVKVYGTAYTEGVSKGFRNLIKNNFNETANDQASIFLALTDKGYAKVQSESPEVLSGIKEKFDKVKNQLS